MVGYETDDKELKPGCLGGNVFQVNFGGITAR